MPLMLATPNPLRCLDIPPRPGAAPAPSPADLFRYLLDPEAGQTADAFVQRYREVEEIIDRLPVAPTEPTILRKLVWPLRHAICSYCLGDFLGTVAASGTVGEMVANTFWEIGPGASADLPLDKQGNRRPFERLGQEERVDVLLKLGRFDGTVKGAFTKLRKIRRGYLHLLSKGDDTLKSDARAALGLAADLLLYLLALSFPKPGTVAFRAELFAYVTARVPLISDDTEPAETS